MKNGVAADEDSGRRGVIEPAIFSSKRLDDNHLIIVDVSS